MIWLWFNAALGFVLMLFSTALLATLVTDPKAPRPKLAPAIFMFAGGVVGAVLFLDSIRRLWWP